MAEQEKQGSFKFEEYLQDRQAESHQDQDTIPIEELVEIDTQSQVMQESFSESDLLEIIDLEPSDKSPAQISDDAKQDCSSV